MGRPIWASGTLWASVAFAAAVVLVTWPLALDLDAALLFSDRKFDGLGTVWFGEHAWRAFHGEVPLLRALEVNAPEGLDLRLADSFLYGLLYLPLRIFLNPVETFNLFSMLAIATTGIAGYIFAKRALDASWAGAFACGVIQAFNSLMHSFRIEGEAYLLTGAFLPLLACELVLLVRTGAARHGVGAGLMLGALAWSSGYLGVNGLLLTGALVLGLYVCAASESSAGLRRGLIRALRDTAPGLQAFAVVGGVLLVALAALVVSANLDGAVAARTPDGQDPLANVVQDSVSLSGLLVPFPAVAHLRAHRIFYVGMAPLVLGLTALVVVPWRKWLPWAAVAAAGFTMALGPALRMDDMDAIGAALPYAWIYSITTKILVYRMPYRFLAVIFVGLGALVALLLTRLRDDGLGVPWRAALLGGVVADSLLFTGVATDVTFASAAVPDGYASLSGRGAVLDFWGYDRHLLKYAGRSAFYQVFHDQRVLCDFTKAGDRQTQLSRRLGVALVNGDRAGINEVLDVLQGFGVTDIAFHSGTFPSADANTIREQLAQYTDAAPVPEDSSGDPVEVFFVRSSSTALSMQDALDRVESWEDPS